MSTGPTFAEFQLENDPNFTGKRALVVGATGAIGRHVVNQLLKSEKWASVTTATRKEITLSEDEEKHASKLNQLVVNFDNVLSASQKLGEGKTGDLSEDEKKIVDAWKGNDVVFCGLGTTRAQAGSAEEFVKIDRDYVVATAKVAKEVGVKHFSLVTAQGANANLWASNLSIFHALLYSRTKGEAEEGSIKAGIDRVSIFRPGMLEREKGDRFGETFAAKILPTIHVATVARAMIAEAESVRVKKEGVEQKPGQWVAFYANADMFKLSDWVNV